MKVGDLVRLKRRPDRQYLLVKIIYLGDWIRFTDHTGNQTKIQISELEVISESD